MKVGSKLRRVFIIAWLVALAILPASSALAEPFGGVEFPGGASSFADAVIAPTAGDTRPADVAPQHWIPSEVLGPPDYATIDDLYMSLGEGGSVTVQFTDNALTGSNNADHDLYVFEIGPAVEASFVQISDDGVTWHNVGRIEGSTRGIDIDAYGFTAADRFYYVRVTDDATQGGSGYPYGGADIDAIGAISTVCSVEAPVLTLDSRTDVSVRLHWTDPSGGTSDFVLERRTGTGSWVALPTFSAGIVTFADTGRTPSRNYAYRIKAIGTTGCESPYSDELSVRTAPARPASLRAGVVTSSAVPLLWNDLASDEDGFSVLRSGATGTFGRIAGPGTPTPVGANSTTYVDRVVNDCTTYRYKVSAARGDAESRFAGPLMVTTLPSKPASLVTQASTSRALTIGWSDPSPRNTGFTIERKIAGVWTTMATLPGDATSFTDRDGLNGSVLTESTSYLYRVKAVCGQPNSSGVYPLNSVWSTITAMTRPAAPSELMLTLVGTDNLDVSFIDNSSQETGFILERFSPLGVWEEVTAAIPASTGSGKVVTYRYENLAPGQWATLRVRASGAGGNHSGFSNVESVMVPS